MNSKVKNLVFDLFSLVSKRDSKFLSLELGKYKEKELLRTLDTKQKELTKKEAAATSTTATSTTATSTTATSTTATSTVIPSTVVSSTAVSTTSDNVDATKTKSKGKTVEKKDVITTLKDDITRLTQEVESVRVSNLKMFFGTDVVTHSLVSTKVSHFSSTYNTTKTEIDTRGEQLYNSFISKNNGLSVINKDKPVITKEVFFKKMLGEEVNSPLDKRLVFELLNLYTQLKNVLHKPASKKSVEKMIKLDEVSDDRKLLETILDKEYLLQDITFKKQLKALNKFRDVISEHILASATKLIQSLKELSTTTTTTTTATTTVSVDDMTTTTPKNLSLHALFTKLMDTPSSFLNTQVHKFGHTFDFVVDKNVVSSVFVPTSGTNLKNVVEKDTVMSYLSRKNNIGLIMSKVVATDSTVHVDNKVKSFLGYLLVNMLYDDILPILSMAKEEEVSYKKKVVDNENKTSYVEDKKKISFNIHKLHPVIVRNMLTRC